MRTFDNRLVWLHHADTKAPCEHCAVLTRKVYLDVNKQLAVRACAIDHALKSF